jgi:flagellar capping protein FliD
MKLINEAQLDDQFNTELSKIQASIMKLEKICKAFMENDIRPVSSQISAVTASADDLSTLATKLSSLRNAK